MGEGTTTKITAREGGYKMRGRREGNEREREIPKNMKNMLESSNDLEGVLHHYHLSIFPGKHTFSEGKSEER